MHMFMHGKIRTPLGAAITAGRGSSRGGVHQKKANAIASIHSA